jgi:hypothetical protein
MKKILVSLKSVALIFILSWTLAAPADSQAVGLSNFLELFTGGSADAVTLGQQSHIFIEYLVGVHAVIDDNLVCTPVTAENVIISMVLPSQTTFVSEDTGIGIFDAGTRTVTWNLGTLDASLGCIDKAINVVIKADPPLPDGLTITGNGTATISTTTPDEDPTGNARSFNIDLGYKPVEVWLYNAYNQCDAVATDPILGIIDQSHQVGSQNIGCEAVGDGGGSASSSAVLTPGMDASGTSVKIGELHSNGAEVRFSYSHSSFSFSGYRPTINGDIPQHVGAGSSISFVNIGLKNSNPYNVPLVSKWRLSASNECFGSNHLDSLSTASGIRYAMDTLQVGSYGYLISDCSGQQSHSGSVYVENDGGASYLCTIHLIVDGIEQPDISVASNQCFFPPAQAGAFIRLPDETNIQGSTGTGSGADSEITAEDVVRGNAQVNASGYLSFSVSTSQPISPTPAVLIFKAESPVNLLVTNSAGQKTGFNPGSDGPLFFAEIPGSSYSGEQSEPEIIFIPLLEVGSYHLDIYGTGDGPYKITTLSQDPLGNELGNQILTGTAFSGSHIEQDYTIGNDGSVIFGIPSTATPCQAGTFSATGNTPCTPAPAGSYISTTGATEATPCLAGSFQPNSGSTSCILADPGDFVSGIGAIAETPCLAGTFAANAGSTSCTTALAGSFVAGTGATQATPCAAGSYQPNEGQTSCILADPGFFVSTTGTILETPCPAGTTSDGLGNTSCHVISPAEQIHNLINTVNEMNLSYGMSTSLVAKLNTVIDSLSKGNCISATNELNAFINEVNAQSGKKISQAQANSLLSGAKNILDTRFCL